MECQLFLQRPVDSSDILLLIFLRVQIVELFYLFFLYFTQPPVSLFRSIESFKDHEIMNTHAAETTSSIKLQHLLHIYRNK